MPEKLSEAAMCADFSQWVTSRGWVCHSEVGVWDQVILPGSSTWERLLVAGGPHWKPGDFIGVHAKLNANADVLWQAINDDSVPWRVVMVRRAGDAFLHLAAHLGIGVLLYEQWTPPFWGAPGKWDRAPLGWTLVGGGMKRFEVRRKLELPVVVTGLPAGVPNPKSLTRWRAAALLLCHELRQRGWLSSADFKEHKISPELWKRDWLRPEGKVIVNGKSLQKLVPTGAPLPDVGWEAIQAQLVAYHNPAKKQLESPQGSCQTLLTLRESPATPEGNTPEGTTREP
jgi:hypothetical protein